MDPNTPLEVRTVYSLDSDGPALSIRYTCGHVVAVVGPLSDFPTCPQCAEAERMENRKDHPGAVGDVLTLRTADHPGSRTRLVRPEDTRCYFVSVPLDDGRRLTLEFGPEGRANLERLILDTMMRDDTGRADAVEDTRKR